MWGDVIPNKKRQRSEGGKKEAMKKYRPTKEDSKNKVGFCLRKRRERYE